VSRTGLGTLGTLGAEQDFIAERRAAFIR